MSADHAGGDVYVGATRWPVFGPSARGAEKKAPDPSSAVVVLMDDEGHLTARWCRFYAIQRQG
jgi:hypothetical protein